MKKIFIIITLFCLLISNKIYPYESEILKQYQWKEVKIHLKAGNILKGIIWDIQFAEENNYNEYFTGTRNFNTEYGATGSESIRNENKDSTQVITLPAQSTINISRKNTSVRVNTHTSIFPQSVQGSERSYSATENTSNRYYIILRKGFDEWMIDSKDILYISINKW
jgi:hypothetical protein